MRNQRFGQNDRLKMEEKQKTKIEFKFRIFSQKSTGSVFVSFVGARMALLSVVRFCRIIDLCDVSWLKFVFASHKNEMSLKEKFDFRLDRFEVRETFSQWLTGRRRTCTDSVRVDNDIFHVVEENSKRYPDAETNSIGSHRSKQIFVQFHFLQAEPVVKLAFEHLNLLVQDILLVNSFDVERSSVPVVKNHFRLFRPFSDFVLNRKQKRNFLDFTLLVHFLFAKVNQRQLWTS